MPTDLPSPTPEPTITPHITPLLTPTLVPETVITAIAGRTGALPEIKMISVSGATFTRYDDLGRDPEAVTDLPGQTVELTRRFLISTTEVTQELYEAVTGKNPSEFKGNRIPVHNVSWYEAVEFCNMLSQWEGLHPAYTIDRMERRYTITWQTLARGYRLPTEAEWEYACRGQKPMKYITGNELFRSHAYFLGADGPRSVGLLSPNDRGMFDVHGNVREWVWDGFGSYTTGTVRNPGGNPGSKMKVIRGGSWNDPPEAGQFTSRQIMYPYESDNRTGFRIVRMQ